MVGYSINVDSVANSEYVQAAAKWAGITATIVAQPLLGSAARTGAERVLGTILGGACGLLLHQSVAALRLSNMWNGILKSFGCSGLAALAILIGEKKLGLSYSSKLFQITMLLVTFAAESSDATEQLYFLSRVAGISAGVILMLVLSVVLLPKSATNEALKELGDALEDLLILTDELFGVDHSETEDEDESNAVTVTLLKDRRHDGIAKRFSLLAENLAEMEQNMNISKSERVILKRPKLVLVPRVFPSGRSVLPSEQLRNCSDDVRQVIDSQVPRRDRSHALTHASSSFVCQVAESISFLHRTLSMNEATEDVDVDQFISALRRVLNDIKEHFPTRSQGSDERESLRQLSDFADTTRADPVTSAAVQFVVNDVCDLWQSFDLVVPLLPTYHTG